MSKKSKPGKLNVKYLKASGAWVMGHPDGDKVRELRRKVYKEMAKRMRKSYPDVPEGLVNGLIMVMQECARNTEGADKAIVRLVHLEAELKTIRGRR